MKNHFNFKSLAFYGIAIASVLILFNVVTAYGEKNLQAPAAIEGRYPLTLAQNLPICPQESNLVLDIQQSGIYFNGSLLPANTDAAKAKASQKRPTITGKMSNQKLSMAGIVPGSTLCNSQASQQIDIQSQVDGKTLKGQIALAGIPKAIEFTAQQEAPAQASQTSGSH
jgi:hypothetical protein